MASRLFIGKVLDFLIASQDATIETLARAKFRLVDALGKVIGDHRDVRETTAFEQAVMFPQSGLDFQTSADYALTFKPENYAFQTVYSGGTQFQKHFDRRIGDLKATAKSMNAPCISTGIRR